ncbi:MAG: hypothetical protein KAS07_06090 [Candidatus Pacebacteria bacterium]|nr:hypothetical protein [Candidatus Paceibacterota bacterium]
MPTCECSLVGLLNISYSGIISASIGGGTTVEISDEGLVLLGATINNLSLSAYAFSPGGDWYLGVSCASQAQANLQWIQKYDCFTDTVHFIPKSGGKASITGGPINGVSLECDPNIVTETFSASAQSGPSTAYITTERRDGFNLKYTGTPIPIESGSPRPYTINLGPGGSITAYLQSFSLSVAPPAPATVQYSFVFTS